MVAPVGLEGGLDSLKDKDKVMSRRNWRLSGSGEAWVLPGGAPQLPGWKAPLRGDLCHQVGGSY